MVRLVESEVKTCKPPSSPGPAGVDHDVIGRTTIAYRSEQKKSTPQGAQKGRPEIHETGIVGQCNESLVNCPVKYVRLSDS